MNSEENMPVSRKLLRTLFREGMNLLREGETERAVWCFETILERDGNQDASTEYNLALGYSRLGRVSDALSIFNRMLEKQPDDPDIYFNTGKLLWRSGRTKQALTYLKKALQIEPEHPGAMCMVGIILGKNLGRHGEAVKFLESALKIQWDFAEAHQALGICHHHLGDTGRAIKHLEKVVELEPENSAVHNHLGIMYMTAGDEKKAEEHFRRALEINPDAELKHKNLWDMETSRPG